MIKGKKKCVKLCARNLCACIHVTCMNINGYTAVKSHGVHVAVASHSDPRPGYRSPLPRGIYIGLTPDTALGPRADLYPWKFL